MNEQEQAKGTVSSVISDLRRIVLAMPHTEPERSATAGTLDRLASELAEAAALLRKV